MIDDTAGTSGELTLVMQRGKHTLIEHSCSAVRDAVAVVLNGMKSPFTVYEVDQTVKVTAIIGDVSTHYTSTRHNFISLGTQTVVFIK